MKSTISVLFGFIAKAGSFGYVAKAASFGDEEAKLNLKIYSSAIATSA